MSKLCPHTGERVVYLVCQECDDRICERHTKPRIAILPKKDKDAISVDQAQQSASERPTEPINAIISGDKPNCTDCCNCSGCSDEMLGKNLVRIHHCLVYHNHLIDANNVSIKGCEYHNRDMSKERICMNCEHFLGGGDWGLACKDDYYKLPSALTPACDNFKPRES